MKKRRIMKREEVVAEYLAGEASYRELELRYGIAKSTLHKWVRNDGAKTVGEAVEEGAGGHESGAGEGSAKSESEEIRRLRKELRRSELHNQLLNTMIDIAEEQMGVSIRKKPGAKR